MKLYLRLINNAYQQNLMYKLNVLINLISQLIGLFITISLWSALYDSNKLTHSVIGAISLKEMIYYVVLSTGITIIIGNQVIGEVDAKIKSGMIGIDLIRPINFFFITLCNTIGNNLFNITFQLVPLCLIAALFYNTSSLLSMTLLLFPLSIINAFLINFIISYMIGLLGFWYLSIKHFSRLLEDIVRIFGGVWIPLWFFPKIFITISQFLPFQYIYYIPISIYLGKISSEKAINMIYIQYLWIALLGTLSYLIWIKARKKLIIQGG